MTELILLLVVVAQLVFIGWLLYQSHIQEKRLIKALLSKDVQEFTNSELAEKPKKTVKEKESDLILLSELDDEQFTKAIRKTVKE